MKINIFEAEQRKVFRYFPNSNFVIHGDWNYVTRDKNNPLDVGNILGKGKSPEGAYHSAAKAICKEIEGWLD